MKIFPAICVPLLAFLFLNPVLHADENSKVAILEFQNKAETIITTNRWTMADDLAKKLRKKNKQIQTVSRKDILKQLKELSWNEDRLDQAQEAKLASLGAKYVVYAKIVRWRVRAPWTGGEVQDAREAMLVFWFDVVDLKTNEAIKSFTIEGNASGEVGYIREGDPASFDQEDDEETYDATDVALDKAADTISEILGK